ncbi:MAG: response regulator receiver [Candidatus Saganbacteria bacterium]|uniref:Response regulator receiver n=1 Tax=Candidatus Saganbacteria bacterium TaxID=2575572 RepID=A0A833L2W8_UNCSA|nr:MAG: response regulator receiver [Candidatus Saganbacteria bacterium]
MTKPLIMVVDDEREYTEKIANVIKSVNKYEVITAYSAKSAFIQLKKHRQLFGIFNNRVRLILLDINMPDMDGLTFLEEMRRKYCGEKIGVIMVTAYEDEDKWDKATSNFVVGYITKPFDPELLLSMIDRFFSHEEAYVDMTIEVFDKHLEKMEESKTQPKT